METFELSHPQFSRNDLLDSPASLCVLASNDPKRNEAGALLRKLIAENKNLKKEFFEAYSNLAALAFWHSHEALTSRYHKGEEEVHENHRKKEIAFNLPVIFASMIQ